MVDRNGRIAEEIRKEISSILLTDIKDPRLSKMTSVVRVEVTRDLRYAKVYISVLGEKEEIQNTEKALKNASGFIRREVGHRMSLRYTPELIFEMDDSIAKGVDLIKLINQTIKKDEDK